MQILTRYIPDTDILNLLTNILDSFHTLLTPHLTPSQMERDTDDIGLPLGNLTSQLLTNIYLNHFDQWVKHRLKARHYVRYADDFVFFSADREWLTQLIPLVRNFLADQLHLTLHPNKIVLKTIASGVDFLGWMHFPDHRVLRTATKRRMWRRIEEHPTGGTVHSYLGLLGHGNTMQLRGEVVSAQWLWG